MKPPAATPVMWSRRGPFIGGPRAPAAALEVVDLHRAQVAPSSFLPPTAYSLPPSTARAWAARGRRGRRAAAASGWCAGCRRTAARWRSRGRAGPCSRRARRACRGTRRPSGGSAPTGIDRSRVQRLRADVVALERAGASGRCASRSRPPRRSSARSARPPPRSAPGRRARASATRRPRPPAPAGRAAPRARTPAPTVTTRRGHQQPRSARRGARGASAQRAAARSRVCSAW